MIEKLHAIEQVLGCYLHQDWKAEFDSADDAVSAALRDASDEDLRTAIPQMPLLIELVALAKNETELTSLFLSLGIYYRPEGDGLDSQEWLDRTFHKMVKTADNR